MISESPDPDSKQTVTTLEVIRESPEPAPFGVGRDPRKSKAELSLEAKLSKCSTDTGEVEPPSDPKDNISVLEMELPEPTYEPTTSPEPSPSYVPAELSPDVQSETTDVEEGCVEKNPAVFFSREDEKESPINTTFGKAQCPCKYPGTTGKCMGAFAVTLVLGTISSSWLAMTLFRDEYSIRVWVEIGVFQILFLAMFISYIQCILVNPGTLDNDWAPFLSSKFQRSQHTQFCLKSGLYKPPRAHFCSVTQRLVLNMDHFCPWIANTVGFYNRKFFILFLFYTSITCGYTSLAFAARLAICYVDTDHDCYHVWLMVVFVKDAVLCVVLGNFCLFHWRMACKNETSIERLLNSKPEFDMGKEKNLEQVFGVRHGMWLVPLYGDGPSHDGIDWPTRDLTAEEIEHKVAVSGKPDHKI